MIEPEAWNIMTYGGFQSHGGTPLSLDGLFHGKSQSKMDDLGVSLFQETSYEILVNTPILKRMEHGLILNFVWSPKKLVRRVVSSQKKLPIHHCLGCLNESKWKFFFLISILQRLISKNQLQNIQKPNAT